jgi:hypothetical protein
MAYSLGDLETEITQKIEEQKQIGCGRINADWVAHAVMEAHQNIEGDDRDFHLVCSFRTVRETTRRVMGKYRKNEISIDPQMTMDGFEYLQTHYVVTDSSGDQVMVHVFQMTYQELTEKAEEHEASAKAHAQHARELYRLRDQKFASINAA